MNTKSDRRPIWLTAQMQEQLYDRWRELMVAVHRHGGLLVANAKWRGLYNDFMDRLVEDPFWINQVKVTIDQVPKMLYHNAIPEDDLYAWTQKDGIQTPSQFFGNRGFGRVSWAAPREQGVQPWDEAKVPLDQLQVPEADKEGTE